MPETNLVVVDARPTRESQHFSMFRRQGFWRVFFRNNAVTQGGVATKGFIVPTNIADHLSGGWALENLGPLQGQTTSGTAVTILNGLIAMFPQNGVAVSVPVQTINVRVAVGVNSNTTSNVTVSTVQVDLVKISSAGVITQLSTATDSNAVLVANPQPYNATTFNIVKSIDLSVASLIPIATTERLGLRFTVTGFGTGGGTTSMCLNATGGNANTPTTITSALADIGTTVSMEVY